MTQTNRKHTTIIFVSVILFLCAVNFSAFVQTAAAQTVIQYNRLYNCPKSSMYNFKVIVCASEKFCQVDFYKGYEPDVTFSYKSEIYKSSITDALDAGGCTIDGKPLESVKTTVPPKNSEETDQPPTGETKPAQTGRFKVGDRVLASPMALKDEKYFEKCTVIKDMMIAEGADSYRVLCDDPKGGIGRESYVKVLFIKAWADATPPPAAPECNLNEPAGEVTKASKPTVEAFKRVIYDRLAATANGRKIGTTFETFQIGKSFVNRLTGSGLLHDGAPQGATIYPVKTKFIFCDRHTGSTIRWIYDAQYNCFKDSFGDWICPNSALKLSEPIYLPNK